jgi:hypothetical protein
MVTPQLIGRWQLTRRLHKLLTSDAAAPAARQLARSYQSGGRATDGESRPSLLVIALSAAAPSAYGVELPRVRDRR